MNEATRLIKFSKEGNYGPMIFVQDDGNEHSVPDKDWCVFVDQKCDMDNVNWEKGNTITFSYTTSEKNGRVSYYAKTMKNEGGQQAAPQQQVSTPPSSKDRQIFIQGLFQQSIMGAAAAGVSEEVSDDWYRRVEKYWTWFNNPLPEEKPGDAPRAQHMDPADDWDRGR